jgi:hypothetical protein
VPHRKAGQQDAQEVSARSPPPEGAVNENVASTWNVLPDVGSRDLNGEMASTSQTDFSANSASVTDYEDLVVPMKVFSLRLTTIYTYVAHRRISQAELSSNDPPRTAYQPEATANDKNTSPIPHPLHTPKSGGGIGIIVRKPETESHPRCPTCSQEVVCPPIPANASDLPRRVVAPAPSVTEARSPIVVTKYTKAKMTRSSCVAAAIWSPSALFTDSLGMAPFIAKYENSNRFYQEEASQRPHRDDESINSRIYVSRPHRTLLFVIC